MEEPVVVEVEVRPTEDVEKVKRAIYNLFEGADISESGQTIIGTCKNLSCLKSFHLKLRQQRILDTARSIFIRGKLGGYIEFMLNKQAAYAGKISFVTDPSESPMGPIKVSIKYHDPDSVIDWLAPKTKNGRPLWNREMPS